MGNARAVPLTRRQQKRSKKRTPQRGARTTAAVASALAPAETAAPTPSAPPTPPQTSEQAPQRATRRPRHQAASAASSIPASPIPPDAPASSELVAASAAPQTPIAQDVPEPAPKNARAKRTPRTTRSRTQVARGTETGADVDADDTLEIDVLVERAVAESAAVAESVALDIEIADELSDELFPAEAMPMKPMRKTPPSRLAQSDQPSAPTSAPPQRQAPAEPSTTTTTTDPQPTHTSGRRYPTLARMAAIAARTEQPIPETPPDEAQSREAQADVREQNRQARDVPHDVRGAAPEEPANQDDLSAPRMAQDVVAVRGREAPLQAHADMLETADEIPQRGELELELEPEDVWEAALAAEMMPQAQQQPESAELMELMEPIAPRLPVTTRRLSATQIGSELAALANEERGLASDGMLRAYTAAALPLRPRPLPEDDLIVPVAGAHAIIAALAALAGAVLLIQGQSGAIWALALACIAGAGGWTAYALSQRERERAQQAAGAILLFSQVGMLIWAMALVGPRAALLVTLLGLTPLALHMVRRAVVLAGALLTLVSYFCALELSLQGALHPPIGLTAGAQAILDSALVMAGLALLLIGTMSLQAARERADRAARARLLELRQVRTRAGVFRQEVEDQTERLEHGLAEALHGGDIEWAEMNGVLGPLAESVQAVAERLASLQEDREDRLRLEGAVHRMTRAFERAWLGLPWAWPEPSGTALDDLVAFLRAPRPRETALDMSGDTPPLIPVPSMMTRPPYLRVVTPISTPSTPLPRLRMNGTQGGSATPPPPSARPPLRMAPRNGATPPPTPIADLPRAPLPWDEWDEWGRWDGDDEE